MHRQALEQAADTDREFTWLYLALMVRVDQGKVIPIQHQTHNLRSTWFEFDLGKTLELPHRRRN